MSKVLITCPYYSEGAGGVATFYKVFAERQHNNARLFYIGKDRPCGIARTLWMLFKQYVQLLFLIPKYDLVIVNPSLKPNCIKRDGMTVRLARFFHKKTCVFWRGFDEDYFNEVVKVKYKEKLQKGLFRVDHSIVLGEMIYQRYHSIGLNTPYSFGSTMFDSFLLRNSEKTFDESQFRILFLARIIRMKGIFEALEAFLQFQSNHHEATLVVAGSGEDLEQAKKIASKLTGYYNAQIDFVGDVRGERKRQCYEQADLYLFPSYTEGMPNSVLEAMGMGLPILTSKVGAVPDFFEDGKMGRMMQGHSAEEIQEKLEWFYEHRSELPEMSRYNTQYAAEHFADEMVISRLEQTFESICHGQ